jgi:autoinducer 2-degrading protein
MQVTMVQVQVKPGHAHEFIEACRLNHEGSVSEPGNRRFDVLQSSDDPMKFVLYEAYENAAAAAAHKSTPHYLKWRDTVAPWMAAPRVGIPYKGLFPHG